MSTYAGRLAFDPETNFHVDPDGNRVVTDDGGATWRYATDQDASHFDRYHEKTVEMNSTATEIAVLLMQGGTHEEAMEKWPHHYAIQPDDPHVDGLLFHPDEVAPERASSTQASQASIEEEA